MGLDRVAPLIPMPRVSFCPWWKLETEMFGIEWLRNGVPVDKETSVLTSAAEAIAAASSRRRRDVDRHPERGPDSYRLTDATDKILGVFPIL
jgi:hypothetical protein